MKGLYKITGTPISTPVKVIGAIALAYLLFKNLK